MADRRCVDIAPSIANFGVQYNFNVIAVVLPLMAEVYPQEDWVLPAVSSAAFPGAIVGQLVMGRVGDAIGRNRAMLVTVGLAGVGAATSGLLVWGPITYEMLYVSRLIVGFGIGGVYPLGAIRAAESSDKDATPEQRAMKVAWSFLWMCPGVVAPYVFMLVILPMGLTVQLQFRLLLLIGCLPTIYVIAATAHEKESEEYTKSTQKEKQTRSIMEHMRAHSLTLIGTGVSWYLFDVVCYGLTMFSPEVMRQIFGDKDSLLAICVQSIVLGLMGFPGNFLSLYSLQRRSLKRLQELGFLIMAICMTILGCSYNALQRADQKFVIFILYCACIGALSFGPCVTTYVLPSEVYPPEVRSTFNGLSAAVGKLGALAGTAIIPPVLNIGGIPFVMAFCAVCCVLGVIVTRAYIPASGGQPSISVVHTSDTETYTSETSNLLDPEIQPPNNQDVMAIEGSHETAL